ncbi:outer membrane protein assembly factor BamA [Parvibium lacunae]|uniref:Outer membrane protein assembly factor BamA n=1 Tax=Parvibium lacunae TaxID=1888893 RepID=A0A368L8D6_9BURK|nr:outer membrane protein assembly factor BamA [Parvibium lacunae]RCS59925.1 outer membrane protein assembly factor BamA [Parvibium lacunae]
MQKILSSSAVRFVLVFLGLYVACLCPTIAQEVVIRDIRIEGIQRIEPGTIFTYLPLKVGDTLTADKSAAAIKALYESGFFKDIRLELQGNVLVVSVEERPTVAQVDFVGIKEFDKEQLRKALRAVGVGESRIFDRAALDRAEQELKRQYLSRGKYAVQTVTTVTPLERNRVAVNFAVTEGEVAKIKSIKFVGNQSFKEAELLDLLNLSTPTWLSWYTKNDQYSKEKLTGDLEAVRSFYLNRGYLEFRIDSTQVSITPDKKEIYITVNVVEGNKYTVSEVKLAGEMLGEEKQLASLLTLRKGDVFNREKLNQSIKAMTDRYGQLGYAFANVNAAPEIDREKSQVAFTVYIDPGRRAYVRKVNISGNTRTKDEVIRRELRQFENSWYDADRIKASRNRVDRLGYFKDVQIGTEPVAGASDQVDVNLAVTEKPTGALTFGLGFSSAEKLIVSGAINQSNFLGTGQSLGLSVNSSRLNRVYSLSLTDPYFTEDGVARTYDLYHREFNAAFLGLGDYRTANRGAAVRFGIPFTEHDRFIIGLGYESTQLILGNNAPQRLLRYRNDYGNFSDAYVTTSGWIRDSRDSALNPTTGGVYRAVIDVALPGGDLTFYRPALGAQKYYKITKDYTLAFNTEYNTGVAYGSKPYPVLRNYYAGGIGSVRGYTTSSLGPRDADGFILGGQSRFVSNLEFLFPMPGTGNDKGIRLFTFLDGGNVFADEWALSFNQLRYSSGLGLNWLSPIGPLKLSLGFPLNKKEGDRLQKFQFQVGTGF